MSKLQFLIKLSKKAVNNFWGVFLRDPGELASAVGVRMMPSTVIGRGVASRVRSSKRTRNAELVSKQTHLKSCFAAAAVAAAAILTMSEAHNSANRREYCAKLKVSSSFRGRMNEICVGLSKC